METLRAGDTGSALDRPGGSGRPRRGRATPAWLRWLDALAVIGLWVWLLGQNLAVRPSPHNVSFYAWYGNWKGVLVVSAVVVTFILGFLWPRGRAEWRSAGIYSAFLDLALRRDVRRTAHDPPRRVAP